MPSHGSRQNKAVAYYRTSSSANAGSDKDSLARQRAAVEGYASRNRVDIVAEFYDEAVRGTDAIDVRPGFGALLDRINGNGVRMVLVEDPTRFARDLAVQLAGHELLKTLGIDLIPVNAPDFFTDDTPTATLVRQVLGAISQFEKAQLVAKLRAARDRKSKALGYRCETGARRVPTKVVKEARRLARRSPRTGRKRSLRTIAAELARLGHEKPSGGPYAAASVRWMLERRG